MAAMVRSRSWRFSLECAALGSQGGSQELRTAAKQSGDLAKRDARKLEHDDLLECLQVSGCVDAIAPGAPPRTKQADPVVVMESADADSRESGELTDAEH